MEVKVETKATEIEIEGQTPTPAEVDSVTPERNFVVALAKKDDKKFKKEIRAYRQEVNTKHSIRKESLWHAVHDKSIRRYIKEKRELKALIAVATGITHQTSDEQNLEKVRCHVKCQESLQSEINSLKTNITNMTKEVNRIDKEILRLEKQTKTERRNIEHIKGAEKKCERLIMQLDTLVKRECILIAENTDLRAELLRLLRSRNVFNENYDALVGQLSQDKRYIMELIEYATSFMDKAIHMFEKIDFFEKKNHKEVQHIKFEKENELRKKAVNENALGFLVCKNKERFVEDLQPKEVARREKFREQHKAKIQLYSGVLKKLTDYAESTKLKAVLKKFRDQESQYYSFFTYSNEMSYHITLLHNCMNRLYSNIGQIVDTNQQNVSSNLYLIDKLEYDIQSKRNNNKELLATYNSIQQRLNTLLCDLGDLLEFCEVDISALLAELGNNTIVSLKNVREFFKVLTSRVNDLVCHAFIVERKNLAFEDLYDESKFIVRDFERYCYKTTPVDDVVLRTQCPECAKSALVAESEDSELGVAVHSTGNIQEQVKETLNATELQYRLHSLSECRLPRSKALTAKRDVN